MSFVVTSTHLLSHLGKLCLKCKQKGHFAQMCPANVKGGSQVDVVQRTQSSSQEVHTHFESIELGSVVDARKSGKSLATIQIGGQAVEIKADTDAKAIVIPHYLYEKITKKPLQQIPVHPRGCVRLPTRYKNRQMDLLYLVVDGNFTPLLGCDACLDLEVLKFMNLQLIDSPEPDQATPKTRLCSRKNQFYMDTKIVSMTNLENFQTKYIWKLMPQCHQLYTLPGKLQLLCWNLQEKSSKRWKKLVLF